MGLFDAFPLILDAAFCVSFHVRVLLWFDQLLRERSLVSRYQGRLQAIRFAFLRVWNLSGRQRARDAGDRPSLCRSLGSVLRERESFPSHLQLQPKTRLSISLSLSLSLVGLRIRLVRFRERVTDVTLHRF